MTIHYGFLAIFHPNSIHNELLTNFYPSTIHYGFWPNFHTNTTHYGVRLILILMLYTMYFSLTL